MDFCSWRHFIFLHFQIKIVSNYKDNARWKILSDVVYLSYVIDEHRRSHTMQSLHIPEFTFT